MLNRNAKIAIPCPKCQHKTEESIARLQTNPTLTCAGCGAAIAINADDLKRSLEEVENKLADFQRNISMKFKLK